MVSFSIAEVVARLQDEDSPKAAAA